MREENNEGQENSCSPSLLSHGRQRAGRGSPDQTVQLDDRLEDLGSPLLV